MELRDAREEDLPSIMSLAQDMTRQLAEWSPRYFNPHVDAETRHRGWLTYLVGSDDHDTQVITDGDAVFSFFNVVRQPQHAWVDDLVLRDTRRWREAARLVCEHVPDPWVTCVSHRDAARAAGLLDSGLVVASTYWSTALTTQPDQCSDGHESVNPDPRIAARHTFGGLPFDPAAPGALIISDDSGGYVIGSASATPPLYDPGGPTTVVDQIVGARRAGLLDDAMANAAARGDVQMIVVCANEDHDLGQILERAGYQPEVDLIGTPSCRGQVSA